MWRTSAATNDSWTEWPPKGFSLRRGSAGGGGEARNPPLPVADTGGCSANEATSFASVSAAKRLCRIVRVVGYEVAVSKVFIKDNAAAADSAPHPAHYIRHLLLKEKAFIVVRYARNLAVLSNYRQSPRLISALNQRPRGTPILIGAGWRSQTIGERFKGTDGACADPGTRIFPATGWSGPLPV